MKKTIFSILSLLVLVGLGGCSLNSSTPMNSKELLITSIPPIAAIAEKIAGDAFEVYSIVDENSSPEEYEISTKDLKKISTAKAYFVNGAFTFEKQYLENIKKEHPDLAIVPINTNIELLKMDDDHHDHDKMDDNHHHHDEMSSGTNVKDPLHNNIDSSLHSEGHDHDDEENISFGEAHHHHDGDFDPHYWISSKNIQIIAQNITDYLVSTTQDEDQQNYYKANLAKFLKESATITTTGNTVDHLYIYHPSINYFAHEMGVEVIAFQEHGKETTVASLQDTLKDLDTEKDVVLIDQQTPESFIQYLERKGIRTKVFNPIKKDIIQNLKDLSSLLHY